MPTYEYACKSCDTHLEVVQSFYDDPLSTCESCGGELRKVFGNIGIVFKGSGFYKTDSRGSSTASSTSKTPSVSASNKESSSSDQGSAGANSSSKPASDSSSAGAKPDSNSAA